MRIQAIALVLALGIVAAGCGSKKSATSASGSSSTTTTTSATTTAASAPTTTTTTTTTGSGNAPSFATSKNCAQLAGVGRKFSQAIAAANAAGKSSLTDVASVYKAFADAAPAEIRPDFQTIAAALGNYANALKKSGYTPGKAPTASQMSALVAATKTFSTPKLAAAEQHLNAWSTKNCRG